MQDVMHCIKEYVNVILTRLITVIKIRQKADFTILHSDASKNELKIVRKTRILCMTATFPTAGEGSIASHPAEHPYSYPVERTSEVDSSAPLLPREKTSTALNNIQNRYVACDRAVVGKNASQWHLFLKGENPIEAPCGFKLTLPT